MSFKACFQHKINLSAKQAFRLTRLGFKELAAGICIIASVLKTTNVNTRLQTVLKYCYVKLLHVVILNVINGVKYPNFGQSLTSLFIMLTIHSSSVLTERRTMAHGLVRINSPPSDHIRLKTKFKIHSNIYRYLGAEVYEVQ